MDVSLPPPPPYEAWNPHRFRALPAQQQPEYDDREAFDRVLAKVSALPPIVHPNAIEDVKRRLALACQGKAFVLQGGDCAERFDQCSQGAIESKVRILLQMSLIIGWASRLPVVRIARMAGQFAKPRTSDWETTLDGQRVASYKGDSINGFPVDQRKPDPERLVEAYFHSVATSNCLRTATAEGTPLRLCAASEWDLDRIAQPSARAKYKATIDKIVGSLDFARVIGAEGDPLGSAPVFTSHEGLLLEYEAAITRRHESVYYNLGAHMLWIGDRTRQIGGAHVDYFSGIANPIGVKIGPSTSDAELIKLVQILNPNKEPGKLTLITRYGADLVEGKLPGHIKAVQSTGIPVLWISDPCHGNTESTGEGCKFRNVERMVDELSRVFCVHAQHGSRLGGVHLELTGDNVTECTGGSAGLGIADLATNYQSVCDPRLNYTQSLDLAFAIADLFETHGPQ